MREESSTEGSSEEEADSLDSEDEDTESPEEKDHLGKCYLLEGFRIHVRHIQISRVMN